MVANHKRRKQQRLERRQAELGRRFRASHRWARSSPRKVRLVADQIRGLGINDALEQLQFSTRRAARLLEKVVRSALANAEYVISENRIDLDIDDLVVGEVRVDDGPTIKRWRPRARGMAYPILKRSCHISVALVPPVEAEEHEQPAESEAAAS
ncbi:MAG: 50S ribosomal protein L22 [Planctomycetota bacterium]|nr:MAG: 50S ribosomal protein L22 [Planctomycetota bacterium]